ncbi:cobalamin biosynthesis CbiD domain protein [Burkholderia pseudomallei]|nr:cobalamin biosynthesis CbiD domain protein [Burkholderia pseudomallei]
MRADDVAERHVVRERERQRLLARVRRADLVLQHGARARFARPFGEQRQIDARMAAVQIEMARRELAQLAEAAAQREPRDARAAQVLEHRAREIAHLDQRDVGQAVARAHRVLARVAGARGDVRDAVGARDVDPLMNRRDVRGARERPHDARRAENRQSADDAEARVHRLARERLAVLDADRDVEAARIAVLGRERREVLGHHPARHRVDRRLADGDR